MITEELLNSLYDDRRFNEYAAQYGKALKAGDHKAALVSLELMIQRALGMDQFTTVELIEQGKPAAPAAEQPAKVGKVVNVAKKRGRPPKAKPEPADKVSAKEDLRKRPITAEEKARYKAEDEANKPDPAASLKVSFDICKKSFDTDAWSAGGTKVILIKQERNVNGIGEMLKNAGYKFSDMVTGIEMAGDIGNNGGTPEKGGFWKLTFTK